MVRLAVNVKRVVGGFEYGLNFPVFKSSVTSRKLTTFLFASAVIFRLFFANIWHGIFVCLLSLSALVFDLVWQARHLCKRPISMPGICFSCDRR